MFIFYIPIISFVSYTFVNTVASYANITTNNWLQYLAYTCKSAAMPTNVKNTYILKTVVSKNVNVWYSPLHTTACKSLEKVNKVNGQCIQHILNKNQAKLNKNQKT